MSDPTGIAYLKTFQALYQLGELVVGLVTWAMLASQPSYVFHGPLQFALGVLILAWIMTLLFFVTYITGFHVRLNAFFSSRSSASNVESGETTAGSLAPLSGSTVPQIRWFVMEYFVYLVMSLFLFVALICMTSQTHHNGVWIGACVIGWALAIMYEIHFCLLFRNVEASWPHEWCFSCFRNCNTGQTTKSEKESLVASEAGTSATQP
uniref:uncharacterized protein LOC120337770 n=1 Tax=Styela clava TaxID=7725 RepID=UPI00193A9CD3|nr:uncharacterized protein LOC120337770 [Styela clava]